mgnify:CR=1 FL=1
MFERKEDAFYKRYYLFGFLPLLRIIGNPTHKMYKLFNVLPVVLIKGDEHRKRIYVLGIPVFKIKGNM